MGIQYFEQEKIFKLDTKNTSYVIGIVDQEGFIGHVYYGKRLKDYRLSYLLRVTEPPFIPSENNRDRISFMDCFPVEYPGYGRGDYRTPAFVIRNQAGQQVCELFYEAYEIYRGKKGIPGLPSSFGTEEECETLVLHCRDGEMKIDLFYTVFEKTDVIVRHTEIHNNSFAPIWIEKVASMSLDMDNKEFETITLHGSWARERHIQRKELGLGSYAITSQRGESGHQDHPFLGLAVRGADQERGDVYGVQLMYSGNFEMKAEINQFDSVRWQAGIAAEGFCWKLEQGETFYSPEALLVYSQEGLGGMSRRYHDFLRNHVIRSLYKDKKRPILINNWEATYFDFSTEKLLDIAGKAASLGIEMLVMDDGWFGNRFDDNRALGDWIVNEKKLPGGLKYLVDGVNRLGMKFGIWFEPEMISPDSVLYEKHPDWVIRVSDRTPARARNQYVLDFSRKEVVDGVWEMMEGVLKSANIEYVKWDANRHLTDVWSAKLPADRQGEVFHRYILGLYDFLEKLTQRFPNLLIEGCSGGGGRFDAGMMYYHPQIWCSDDTDAIERLDIQYGTSFGYPISTVGSHVSVCPNHQTGRSVSMKTRGIVAMAGTFGYELDITRLSQEEKDMVKIQVEEFKKYYSLIQQGDYYRLTDDGRKSPYVAWEFAAEDGTEALLNVVTLRIRAYAMPYTVRIKGLKPEAVYEVEGTGEKYPGAALMNGGYLLPVIWDDYQSVQVHFVECCE